MCTHVDHGMTLRGTFLISFFIPKAVIMSERFVSEAIKPVTATCATLLMAAGGPGLPREFLWRGRTVVIRDIKRTWRETGKCSHGSPELYVRKHWFEVTTDARETMKIYFERQDRGGRKGRRWWLFSIREADENQPEMADEGKSGDDS